MGTRKNTFLVKRSNIAGNVPTSGQLLLGELALNTADVKLYTSGTTANSILPIGWDRVARTGDTMTGTLFTPSISATTINVGNYIKFSTGSTAPITQSGVLFYDPDTMSLTIDSFVDPNVRIKLGRQLYSRMYNNTGTLITKGSAIKFQSATNGIPNGSLAISSGHTPNQVVGLAAADIQAGAVGLVITQGILSGTTITSFNIGDILYLSDTVAGSVVSSTSSLQFSSRSHQIGYVIATGTTTGEIYVSINNEDTNLSLTDIERNILEGNVISTGAYEFTGATVASSTTINVAPMRGWVVKNTYGYVTLPEVTNLYYTGGTNISITNISSADSTYLLINSGATLYQQTTFPTPQQRRENIYLGKVNHPNRTSILNINNTVDYDVSAMSSLRDLWSPIKYINQGIIPSPNGANLSFNTSAGTLWGNGINWHNNQLNPNSVSISGKTPASFFYRTQTGGTSSSVTVIDPTKYDVGGVITSIGPVGSNDATNQRIYLYPTGVINVLYGQTRYATLAAAIAAIQSETFIPYPNAESTGILIGVISVRNDIVADGQPLTNTNYAKFTLVSKFGESFGGTGGLSTTTLQQAYENSTTPEIVINSILGGLSIENGTGNANNVTNLLEGINSTGSITSLVRADGYISGTTLQTNGFNANSNGVTATTVTATTMSAVTFTGNLTGLATSATTALNADLLDGQHGSYYYPASNPNGYISSFTETDPTVPSHVKAITTTNISNWNTAFGWGNHASAGYVPGGRTITINGTTQDLSENRSFIVTAVETDTLATVTSRGNSTTGNITVNGDLSVKNSLLSNQSNSVPVGTTAIFSNALGSTRAAFFDYVVTSGSNARAGSVMVVINGGNVEFTETSTNDIGDTSRITLKPRISGGNILLDATSTSGTWTVKVLVRLI